MNREELRAEIARKNISKKQIAEELGITSTALYNKMSGKCEFKESEIRKLIAILELSAEAVNNIFLS